MTILITLAQIRAHSPCANGWQRLLRSNPGNGPFPLSHIVESNGLDDALWCTRCLPEHDKTWRLFAVWCARQVTQSDACLKTLDVAERFANGQATEQELAAASATAWDAARDAAWDAARDAASDAAWAAAWAAAGAAAWDAARDAARDVLAPTVDILQDSAITLLDTMIVPAVGGGET